MNIKLYNWQCRCGQLNIILFTTSLKPKTTTDRPAFCSGRATFLSPSLKPKMPLEASWARFVSCAGSAVMFISNKKATLHEIRLNESNLPAFLCSSDPTCCFTVARGNSFVTRKLLNYHPLLSTAGTTEIIHNQRLIIRSVQTSVWYSITILRFSLCGRYVKQNLPDKSSTNKLVVLPIQ